MTEENSTHELDLPLSSNIKDVLVHHFILDWSCDLIGEKHITLFLSNVCSNSSNLMDNQKSSHDHASHPVSCNDKDSPLSNHSVTNSNCSYTNTERKSSLPSSSCTLVKTQSLCASEVIYANDNGCAKTSKGNACSENRFQAHEDLESDYKSLCTNKTKLHLTSKGNTCSEKGSQADGDLKSDNVLCMNKTELHRHGDDTKNVTINQGQNTGMAEVSDIGTKNVIKSDVIGNNIRQSEFVVTLDACDLDILRVEEVPLTDSQNLKNSCTVSERKADIQNDQGFYMSHVDRPGEPLQFELQKHCVNISKQGVYCVREFPQVVRITYLIKPEGKSFKWTKDADGKDCGLTIGHWINNRSMFPSQDAPSAMPTWQAIVHAPRHLTVLMSGDEDGRLIDRFSTEESHGYFFYTSMPMPTSTLAIAFGEWNCIVITENNQKKRDLQSTCIQHGSNCQTNFSCCDVLPCRLLVPDSLKEAAIFEMRSYLPLCFQAVKEVLGPHPFQRLDILVAPECFDSLGMASPSLLFLSQSLLSGNFSMLPRVSHELCHSWFGLLIGPRDWTEEWLTEGFCTYLEDIIHCKVMKWSEKFTEEFIELRAILRYKTLYSEVQHTDETLQLLRPNQGDSGDLDHSFVKNGMNPDKAFMQVHYLKGYFLLCFMEKKVGRDKFLTFLKEYVARFHGELVSSLEFIGMFFECFPEVRQLGLSEDCLSKEWLDYPGIHDSLTDFADEVNASNSLIAAVNKEVQQINVWCERLTKKSNKRRRLEFKIEDKELVADQLILLLEKLLERNKLPEVVFTDMRDRCSSNGNAEISHRLCELIVKHKYVKYYTDVQIFLVKHQAMGVYLYGEMMLSSNQNLIQLARKCFAEVKAGMPDGVYKTVYSMLFG